MYAIRSYYESRSVKEVFEVGRQKVILELVALEETGGQRGLRPGAGEVIVELGNHAAELGIDRLFFGKLENHSYNFV